VCKRSIDLRRHPLKNGQGSMDADRRIGCTDKQIEALQNLGNVQISPGDGKWFKTSPLNTYSVMGFRFKYLK
jgi:hypothetical protein